jgi:urease accessory protein
MAVGGCLGMMAVTLPFTEQGIAASVLVLGVLIAAAVRLPLVASMLLVGLFALFHGHTHGAEMPETVAGFTYGLGFIVATACLHAIGISIGILGQHLGTPRLVRYAGTAIALCGIYLCVA